MTRWHDFSAPPPSSIRAQDRLAPRDTKLTNLRAMMSTGSPLSSENFDFVYDAVKPDIHLASISGGTDICGCFVGGNPLGSVWRGEIQGPMLGMAMDVLDDNGRSVKQEKGERSAPAVSRVRHVLNDSMARNITTPISPALTSGAMVICRDHCQRFHHPWPFDALNPGGALTAEIYAQVEHPRGEA
jgi:acetoacetyl-CoA synthetase